ncbi:MAG TPA: hypothetical protein VGR43_06225 [Dehalococcoidia bacterium]|jgi:hypothetical protein|nr:hypothetical protein [Dehalococcoidia bacterium]
MRRVEPRSSYEYFRTTGRGRWARTLLGVASLLVVVGMLLGSVTPAAACSCALPLDDATAAQVLKQADLVVAGTVAETKRDRVEIAVERVYAGESVESATVAQPEGFAGDYGDAGGGLAAEIGADCSYTITGGEGERYLLVLHKSERVAGAYEAEGCTSMSFRLTVTDDYYASSLTAIERAAGPADLPFVAEDDGGGGFPWAPAAAIGAGAVVGVVGAGAFLWRRSSRQTG